MPQDLSPLWISIKTALVATAIAAILGILAARWMLGYRGRGRSLIDGFLTLPLVLPPTVVGFLLLLLLGKNGPVGQLLDQWGVTLIFTWTATAIAATVVAFPLMYKTVLGGFEQVDPTLLCSARTLGASEWRVFWQILLPLAGPGILAGTVLAFARALGEFGATLMVGGSIPGVTQTIPIAIFFAAEAGRMQVALVWVLLMIAVALVAIAGIHRSHHHQTRRPTFATTLFKQGFNWLFFGTGRKSPFRHYPTGLSTTDHWVAMQPAISTAVHLGGSRLTPEPTSAYALQRQRVTAPQLELDPIAMPPLTPAALVVQIEKHIPGFHLDVNFQADRAPLGLLGASGSGKSMTLRCIAGLETPTRGRIVLNGRVLFDAERKINVPSRDRKVGLVFQNYALFPHLTVAQNIAFGMCQIPKHQRIAEVVNYLDRLGLTGLGDRYPAQLSGGQQQRVALARALAIQPDILLLDEPLSALDTYLRSHIEKLLIEVLAQYHGITLFITHKLEEAYRVCRNLIVLSHGTIQAAGKKEEIFQTPPTFEVAKVTECKNFSRARRLDPYHIEALDWDCLLRLDRAFPAPFGYVGLRAHHVQFAPDFEQNNTFPGWVTMTTETQHRISLYLKLHHAPRSRQDYHLQVEIYREKWEQLQHRPAPWPIRLAPDRLMPLAH